MTREEMIGVLDAYRRPDSPVYDTHFRKLPAALLTERNVPDLIDVVWDESLPLRVRDHAAGALGEIGDPQSIAPLVEALASTRVREGQRSLWVE